LSRWLCGANVDGKKKKRDKEAKKKHGTGLKKKWVFVAEAGFEYWLAGRMEGQFSGGAMVFLSNFSLLTGVIPFFSIPY
jgi:hypothetical protein